MQALRGSPRKRIWIAAGSFVALVAGLLVGIAMHRGGASPAPDGLLSAIGGAWINALRLTILPLVAAQLVATFSAAGSAGRLATLGGLSGIVFGTMLVLGGVVTVLTTPLLLSLVSFSPEGLTAFRAPAGRGGAS